MDIMNFAVIVHIVNLKFPDATPLRDQFFAKEGSLPCLGETKIELRSLGNEVPGLAEGPIGFAIKSQF